MKTAREPELRIVRRRTVDLDPELADLVRPSWAATGDAAPRAARRTWRWTAAVALALVLLVTCVATRSVREQRVDVSPLASN